LAGRLLGEQCDDVSIELARQLLTMLRDYVHPRFSDEFRQATAIAQIGKHFTCSESERTAVDPRFGRLKNHDIAGTGAPYTPTPTLG